MEMNVEKTQVMRILNRTTDYERSETTGECGIFQIFG
jgi:hypothetical protein